MKKIVLILAVLTLAVPASAQVKIYCGSQPYSTWGDMNYCANTPWKPALADQNIVTVYYDATSEANNVRAYALDITLTDPYGADNAVINSVTPAKVGESNSTSKGYGIFMGSIVIDSGGNVTDWNTPVAPAGDPCAAGPLGSKAITVELGSLYVGAANAPPKSGQLFTFRVNNKACTVTITENTRRGGIVMENPDEVVSPNMPVAYVLCPGDIRTAAPAAKAARNGVCNFADYQAILPNYGKCWPNINDYRTNLRNGPKNPPDVAGCVGSPDYQAILVNYGKDWQ